MQVTRDQVAQRAQVSSATVSRVFNNPTAVSPALREAVLRSAKELGYSPNKAAGVLRRKGTGVLGFVEMEKGERPYYWGNLESFDWFFGRSIRGVQAAIRQSSWQLQFYKVRTKEELKALERTCDGILAYDVDTDHEISLYQNLNIPSVLAHHIDRDAYSSSVVTDNYFGGILQAEYLQKMGCEKPCYITGYLATVPPHRQRLEGFLSRYPKARVVETKVGSNDAISDIQEAVRSALARQEIDCLAAVNDVTLFELLLKTGCTVPCVGYDASPFYRLFEAPLASIDIQSDELYRKATLALIDVIGGSEPSSSVVMPRLIQHS